MEENGLRPPRTDAKLSLTEPGAPEIRPHSFKEGIKESAQRDISLSHQNLLSCQHEFTVLQSSIYFSLLFSISTHFPRCHAERENPAGQLREATTEQGNPQLDFPLPCGGGSDLTAFLLAVGTHGGAC